jgi:hypothetical protein
MNPYSFFFGVWDGTYMFSQDSGGVASGSLPQSQDPTLRVQALMRKPATCLPLQRLDGIGGSLKFDQGKTVYSPIIF